MISVNKFVDLSIDFKLNYRFYGLFNKKDMIIDKSLLQVI